MPTMLTLYGNAQTQQNTVTQGAQTNLQTVAMLLVQSLVTSVKTLLRILDICWKNSNYTNSNQAEIERLEDEIKDLQRNRNLSGSRRKRGRPKKVK